MCYRKITEYKCGHPLSEGWSHCDRAKRYRNRPTERCEGNNAHYDKKTKYSPLNCPTCIAREKKETEDRERAQNWSGSRSFLGIGNGHEWANTGGWRRG